MTVPPAPKRCLLFVEDEQALLNAFSRAFARAGFEVLSAQGVTDAIAQWSAHRERIVLILSDVQMPGPPVEDLIARARADDPTVPILLMSGEIPGSEGRYRALVEMVNGFLPKPMSLDFMRREVERLARP